MELVPCSKVRHMEDTTHWLEESEVDVETLGLKCRSGTVGYLHLWQEQ